MTLDEFVRSHKIRRVELNKLDVEGSELLAVREARQSLSFGVLESLIVEVANDT